MKNKDNRNENGFNKKLYIIGAAVIVLICIIATAIEVKYKGTESALINADSVDSIQSTSHKKITPTTTIPTEKPTEAKSKPTDTPIKPTENATRQKARKAEKTSKPPKETKPTEQPTAENKAEEKTEWPTAKSDTEVNNNNNGSNSNGNNPSSPIVIEKPTQLYIQLPQYTEQDIVISPSVVYLKVGDTANVDVIFPAGLSSAGVSWNIDNSMVATFSSANFNTTTLIGKSPGTTTVYAYPKGYSVTLQCTVVVSQ